MQMEVSQEEEALINAHRRNKHKRVRRYTVHVIGVAARYAAWMQDSGAGNSYSTFCDDFGYQPVGSEPRSQLHDQVMNIIRAVDEMIGILPTIPDIDEKRE